MIEATVNASMDYGSNTIEPTYPDGLDVEVIRYHVLKDIWRAGGSSAEREHVTLGIYRHPKRFRLLSVKNELDHSALRWTVDEFPDLLFIERVYAELYPSKNSFETDDILALLAKHPELVALNAGIRRNEGLAKSLAAERSSLGRIPKDIAK